MPDPLHAWLGRRCGPRRPSLRLVVRHDHAAARQRAGDAERLAQDIGRHRRALGARGRIEDAADDAEKVQAAAAELASKFPPEDVSLYFSTLVSQDPETWKALVDSPHTLAG